MSYEGINWENLPSTNTPITASNLNMMDSAIVNKIVTSSETPLNAEVWIKSQKNLFDKSTITSGYFVHRGNGATVQNAEWGYSDYIDVEGLSNIYIKANIFPTSPSSPGICYYNSSKVYQSGEVVKNAEGSFSIPTGTKYIRYSILLTQNDTLQIVAGNEKKDDGIFYKNDILNAYQEVLVNNFSTQETKIGTWIDGKPLYRKVVSVSALKNSATTKIYVGSGLILVNFDIFVSNGQITYKLPFNGSNPISCFYDRGNSWNEINITTTSDRSAYTSNYAILYYYKATE